MMPIDSDRDDGPADDPAHVHGAIRIGQRNLPAFDHRHALAMLHLELLRALAQAQENDEHPGKHAEDEHQSQRVLRPASALQFC